MRVYEKLCLAVDIAIGGATSEGAPYETFDVLTDAQVVGVYPIKMTNGKFPQRSCAVLVEDARNGTRVMMQGRNHMANILSKLALGSSVCAIGQVQWYEGARIFTAVALVDKSVLNAYGVLDEIKNDVMLSRKPAPDKIKRPLLVMRETAPLHPLVSA